MTSRGREPSGQDVVKRGLVLIISVEVAEQWQAARVYFLPFSFAAPEQPLTGRSATKVSLGLTGLSDQSCNLGQLML